MKEELKDLDPIQPFTSPHVLPDSNLSKIIEKTAHLFPEKVAVIYQDQQLTYLELIERSNQFANYLLASGIQQGDLIGLAVECSVEMLICMIGLLRAGAVYVPLDPKYPKNRVEYMLQHSQAKMLIVTQANKGRFQTSAREEIVEDIWKELPGFSTIVTDAAFDSGTAYVLYTSGSTGLPKGVEITHSNLINLLRSVQSKPGISPNDRLLAITTISFDIAGLELFLPLISGAQLIISDLETARDGRLLLEMLQKKNISIMQATPSTWRMMIDSGWEQRFRVKIFCGGEPLPKELAMQLLARSEELWNMYGPTETTIYSIIKQIRQEDEVITIGQPIQHTQVYLLDEQQRMVPMGTPGEIYIGGAGVSAGYLHQPELTAERFVNNPISQVPGAQLYRTGDLGRYLENQDIEYLGKLDQQVKIRGHRIELGEIENVLCQHPQVKQAVVIAREDQPGDQRLAAYLIIKTNSPLPVSENVLQVPKTLTESFKKIARQQLPEYMVPHDYVVLQHFPLTPNYKIDKLRLPKPAPRTGITNINQLPKTKEEKIVAKAFTNTLGIGNISTQDNFFELGGNSLLAVKIMAAIEKETGKRLPLAVLFQHTTIQQLAAKISSEEEEKWLSLVPIQTNGSKRPLYLVHGGGLNIILFKSIAKDMDPEQPIFAFQALGLSKATTIPDSLEEIAAIYVKELLESNPEGPYQIAGYSLGGCLAWEMAVQLQAKGKETSFLAIMDTYAGNADESLQPLHKIAVKVWRQFRKIPFLIKSFIQYPADAAAYQLQMLKAKLYPEAGNNDIPDVAFFSPYETQIYRTYKAAHENYQLKAADLQLHVFRVRKRLYFLDDLIKLGWGRLAKKGVKVNVVPGDHKTFLYTPHDKAFAAILQQEVNQVQD